MDFFREAESLDWCGLYRFLGCGSGAVGLDKQKTGVFSRIEEGRNTLRLEFHHGGQLTAYPKD
jgi:hypothetical protein